MTSDSAAPRDPIELLMQEHSLIEDVLGALGRYTSAVASGVFERADLAHFVAFIREFADARHHRKEEDVLFAAMVAHGFPSEGGPIGMMLYEHEIGRRLVGELAEIADGDGAWTDESAARLVTVAGEYAGMLRAHIAKENDVLYRMARSVLPPPAMHEVAVGCEAIEQDYIGRDEGLRIEKLAADLVQRYPA